LKELISTRSSKSSVVLDQENYKSAE